MNKYVVKIETVSRVKVEAENKEQAVAIAEKAYNVDIDTSMVDFNESYDEYKVMPLYTYISLIGAKNRDKFWDKVG